MAAVVVFLLRWAAGHLETVTKNGPRFTTTRRIAMTTVIPFPVAESEERNRLRRLLARLQQNNGFPADIEITLNPLSREDGFVLSLTGARHRLLAEEYVRPNMFPQKRSWGYGYRRLSDAWWYVHRVGEDRWNIVYYCRGRDAVPPTSGRATSVRDER
jgi:hypothetical protein